ncbi:MAG: Hemerythrin HHE cation binding domain protein [bacterium ADurb.Bin429]|nr:MAG: Hemerythrin HHE cation binding domain protein [bacterium ADurb.Bin429]
MYATDQLRADHEGILVMLSVLERLADDLHAGRAVNLDHLEQILDFLRTFADTCHHGKEEDLLFPALGRAGLPAEGGPVGVMLLEHTQGRAYIRGMMDALEALRAGKGGATDFARNAYGYVELLRAHIDKENDILFVMAERILPPAVHAQLTEEFEKVEHERVGEGIHERFHALIHELEDTYLRRAA